MRRSSGHSMAKLDQLNLRNDGPGKRSEDDQRRIQSFLTLAELLLDDDRFQFAWDTVQSMRDKVQEGYLPTEPMFTALENIRQGGRRQSQQERNWRRRYEGR